jgi:hypothetical protein
VAAGKSIAGSAVLSCFLFIWTFLMKKKLTKD